MESQSLTESDGGGQSEPLRIAPPRDGVKEAAQLTQADLCRQLTVPGHTGHHTGQTTACGQVTATHRHTDAASGLVDR